MTYIGLGHDVDPALMTTHVSTLGLQMNMPIRHKWLDYTPGRTARVKIRSRDVLTGFMSGCIIARWQDAAGDTYVGHVGTVEADPNVNRLVKDTFRAAMPANASGFSPSDAWTLAEIQSFQRTFKAFKRPEVMALVTTSGEFYSILIVDDGLNEWYIGGVKQVPSMAHAALDQYMRR